MPWKSITLLPEFIGVPLTVRATTRESMRAFLIRDEIFIEIKFSNKNNYDKHTEIHSSDLHSGSMVGTCSRQVHGDHGSRWADEKPCGRFWIKKFQSFTKC